MAVTRKTLLEKYKFVQTSDKKTIARRVGNKLLIVHGNVMMLNKKPIVNLDFLKGKEIQTFIARVIESEKKLQE